MINPGIKTRTTQTDRETILSHRIEQILNIQIHNKTTEIVHQNNTDNFFLYKQQKKLNQILPVVTVQKFQNEN